MNRVCAGKFCGADQARDVQIAIDRFRGTYPDRFVGEPDEKSMAIGLGKDGYRFDAHLLAREDDPQRNFTAIRDKYFLEHNHRGRMAKSFSPYSTGWPFSTRML